MKNAIATTALILVAGLSATSGFAADSSPRARLNNTDTSSYFAKSAPSVLSRSEVKADLAAAAKSGNLPAMGEKSFVAESAVTSTVTRAAVKADYLQAQKAGTLPPMGDRG
jgi:hypothetical protein